MSCLNDMLANPKELLSLARSLSDSDNYSIGLRGLYDGDNIGPLKPSYVWDDGNMTDDILPGTSCIVISPDIIYNSDSLSISNINTYASNVFCYGDGRVGLVIGEGCEGGNDNGEVIIYNAKLVHIFDCEKEG